MVRRKGPPNFFALALCTGNDAWTQWKYQVRLSDNTTVMNITSTQVTLNNLEANATYAVQILPYSSSGRGPLSMPFRGKTLPEVGKNITILWSARNGLYATDPMGEHVKPLQSASIWVSAEGPNVRTGTWFPANRLHLAATAWCNEFTTYLLLSNGTVYQSGGKNVGRPLLVRGIVNAQSIAYDYIGEKLYWSDPKKQTILRCGLNQCWDNGHNAEWLQIDTIAKEIAIDSSRAVLVWSTGHSLETSRLNGLQPFTLYQAGLFSGVHITGITLDTDRSRLFFVTRSSQGSSVYKMDYTLHPARIPEVVVVLEDISILGPIRYFHDRLLWLQDSSVSILMDLQTKSRTTLELRSIENVTSFQIRDLSTWKYPGGHTKNSIKVFPASVIKHTVKLEGAWNNFTINWKPVNNTNQGTISYSIVVSMKHTSISRLIESSSMMISTDKFPPFSEIEVKIVAMSYWASSRPTLVRLTTPAGTPSAPLNPRVFVEKVTPFYRKVYYQERGWNLNQPLINAEVRWDPPKDTNGQILGYVVACVKGGQQTTDCISLCDEKNLTAMNCVIRNLAPNTTYRFTISAYTKAGTGNVSQAVTLNTAYGENPVPRMLVTSGTKLEILDLDRNSLQKVFDGVPNPVSAVHFALENTVYWINDGQDLMKTDMNAFNSSRVLSLHPQGVASNLAIDWIGRKLFWANEHNSNYSICTLDLSAIEDVREPAPRVILLSDTAITGLSVNPFKGEILWTAARNKGKHSAFVATTNGTSVKPFLSRDSINCNCSRFSSVGEPITFDPSGYGRMHRGILFLSDNIIYMADENGCYCVKIVNVTSHLVHRSANQPFKIAADHQRVYWSGGYVSATEKYEHSGITELVTSGIHDISVLTPQSQPLPELDCLIPSQLVPEAPTLAQHSSHSLHIMLPNISLSNCPYKDMSMPAPKYKVFYGKVNENGISECTPSNVPSCHVISTSKSYQVITDLSPFTTYTVFVNVTNVYAEVEGLLPLACPAIMLQTAPGAPMPPQLLRIERLTPSSIRVVWRKPLKLNGEKVWYKVHWQPEKRKVSPSLGWKEVEVSPGDDWSEIKSKSNENRTEFHLTVSDLMPGSKYSVWVVAFSEKGDAWSKSENKTVITYPNPRNLTLVHAAPYALSLSWLPSDDSTIIRYQFVYRMGWHTEWNATEVFSISSQRSPHKFLISNLKPKTAYGFRIRAWYSGDAETMYEWPRDMYQPGQFLFETQADKPSSPGIPRARGIGKSLYEVAWERADPNGAEVEFYSLECRITGKENMNDLEDIVELPSTSQNDSHKNRVRRNSGPDQASSEKLVQHDNSNRSRYRTSDWFVVYNGSEPRWEVKGIELNANVSFRVRALNKYGWGDYSNESSSESMESLRSVAEPQHFNIIFGSIVTAVLIVTVFGLSFLFMYRQKLKEKPGLRSPSSAERREVELATLRELPTGSGFVHQNNILYAANELLLDLETAGVPQVLRQQIARTKFLGSGAFGEVYEGLVRDLPGSPLDATKVAIKTLRKRAQTNEKIDFIQEAKSMTQFRHPNILQLMGICIDAGPCCLLLELMNGGDLLSYLRANRPHLGAPVVLTMADLLKMCLDVAKGCVYLEELHFVHRDLAARNCLVRITEIDNGEDSQVIGPPLQERIVKIGDFGLSRDVYRNDYYRKDSAAPVPVRWMAPESLIDGIYTTQSDVWAFGVLVWEIMTLGNQPYPARNNPEVLTYVGGGGRLTPPAHCPPRLTELMLRCWEFFADNRPTFRDCQVELESILSDIQSSPENSASNFPTIEPSELELQLLNNYLQPGSDSKASYTYRSDDNGEGTEVSTLSRDNTPLYPSSFPKYLEIVKHHPTSFLNTMFPSLHEPDVDDGYEKPIPKKPPRNPVSSSTLRNRADDPAQAEIGLPPVPYYNTSSSLFVNRFSNSRGVMLAPSNYPSPYSTNDQTPNPMDCVPVNGKSQMYLNVRKLGLLADADNKDLVAPFRNLLASATSDDGDSSDPELSPGSWRISTSGSLLKNANKDNQESGRQQVASLSDSGIGSAPDALGCYSQDDEDEDFDGLPLQNFDSVPSSIAQQHASLYPYEHHASPHHQDENTNHRFLSNSSLHPTNQLSSMRYYSNNGYLYTDNSNGNEPMSVDPMTFDRRKPVILSDSISLNFI